MSTAKKLQVARQKLQMSDVPFQLRVSYYLRVACSNSNPGSISYSQLMNALFEHNRDWLSTCQVRSDGMLHSSDEIVQALIQPISALYEAKVVSLVESLQAA
ncbi:MAG: hypothetical protein KME16_15000 [Scytolyngbya sp. HA4215-MV1]|jgi:hypothetical protein|nr:hypothetical protein [Scytolyngbya sp. HA4215-MV1]